ncbi:MAG: magnesium transporter [Eubacteriales bacterium]|nr:magnesium transporter [Eubacteriales bacterium]
MVNSRLQDQKKLKNAVILKNFAQIREILAKTHQADIADVLKSLNRLKDKKVLIEQLEAEKVALVLNELESEEISQLLSMLPDLKVTEVFEHMPYDDAADFLGELPESEQEKYLDLFDVSSAEDLQELLSYKDDTAGGIMTTEFIAIPYNISVDKAIKALRENAVNAETVYYVYVINLKNQLMGVISLRELIIASQDLMVSEVMKRNIISVNVNDDQEEVAKVVARYDFLAVPVVDDKNHLLGIITVDDVIDVIHEEAEEDIYKMAGVSGLEDDINAKLTSTLRSRLPWLFVTLLGGFISGNVLSAFSNQLDKMVVLTFFIPLLAGMGGNVGTQSSTVTVRGIATGFINKETVRKTITRELMIGVLIGGIMGSMVAILAYFWQYNMKLGIVVGLSMMANIFTAATMGTLVPLFFKRVGIDPAVASAPFITTAIDVLGLVIYSTLASILLFVI